MDKSDLFKGQVPPFRSVTRNHARRVPDQVDVDARLGPIEREAVDHVMRHMFHVEMRRRDFRQTATGDFGRVGLMCGEDLGPHGMIGPGGLEVGRIKRLIHDRKVWSGAKTIHHSGR